MSAMYDIHFAVQCTHMQSVNAEMTCQTLQSQTSVYVIKQVARIGVLLRVLSHEAWNWYLFFHMCLAKSQSSQLLGPHLAMH